MAKVLLTDRRVALGSDLYRWTRRLRAPGLEVQLIECQGNTTDTARHDEVMGASELGSRTLTVVLEGAYESDDVGAGEGYALLERRHRWRERWSGRKQRFVTIMWEDGPVSSGRERLGPAALAAWRGIADGVAGATEDTADDAAHAALALTRASGIAVADPVGVIPAEVLRVQRGLNVLFTALHESPQAVDLESLTGLSARHLRRILRSHPKLLPSSLRRALHFARLGAADSLMRSTDRSVREIALALGYRSDRALHTALRRSGLR